MDSSIPPTLGRRVAECRDRRGWTQKYLADQAGLSVTFVSEIENDRRTPGTDALLRLADALGASLDYLVKGATAAPTQRPLVIPPELAAIGDKMGWSLRETGDVLKFRRMVLARRSPGGDHDDPDRSLSEEEWLALYRRLYEHEDGNTIS